MACQKSDCLIVVGKPVKAGGAKGAASSRSRRGSSVGTGGRKTMEQETKGIRYQSDHFTTVQGLMHCVNEQSLMEEHRKQSRRKATGVDGVNKAQYDENAEDNIRQLVERMKKFQYKPQPVRRTYIPKANGKLRPLGIPAYEDRLVQGVMANALNEVYEPRFLDCSFGFRPGRSAHDVVRYINQTIMIHKVNYVLEADIKGFFDNVDHDWLMKFLEHDIQDKNFLRYVKWFLIAGIMEGSELMAAINRGQCNYYGVNGNFHAILSFWKYLKYSTYRMLNRRDPKGKLKYPKFLRIWNYYVKEPHLTTDIWNWQPKVA